MTKTAQQVFVYGEKDIRGWSPDFINEHGKLLICNTFVDKYFKLDSKKIIIEIRNEKFKGAKKITIHCYSDNLDPSDYEITYKLGSSGIRRVVFRALQKFLKPFSRVNRDAIIYVKISKAL
jgi:hypothetical protein